jgi:hypothetical protein
MLRSAELLKANLDPPRDLHLHLRADVTVCWLVNDDLYSVTSS